MTIQDKAGGKLAILSKPMDTRPKMINFGWFVVFLFTGGICVHWVMYDGNTAAMLSACVFAIASFGAAYRFINKAAMGEQLFIGSGELRVIKKGLITRTYVYELAAIYNFRQLGKPAPTRHPLAGESFDALGFQTQQELIRELHGDDRLAFDYEGWVIEFGENIYSWEFEELAALVAAAGGDVYRPGPQGPPESSETPSAEEGV